MTVDFFESKKNAIDGIFQLYFFLQKGARGSFGEKANDVLKHTRGKQFRHEKTKKKRGNYKGGIIDSVNVNSIKFED